MTAAVLMTPVQMREAYLLAVKECLTVFYRMDEGSAANLVSAWWKRISQSPMSESDLFLHDEPIDAAADLADADEVPVTDEIRKTYREILSRSAETAVQDASQKRLSAVSLPYFSSSREEARG